MRHDFSEIFHSNSDLFQLSYQINDHLWTHAGVHAGWFEYRFNPFIKEHQDVSNVSDLLNMAFIERFPGLFDIGYRRGGFQKAGGPLWCDKTELVSKPLKGLNQIVGHSRVKRIQKINKYDKKLVFIDVLENEEVIEASSFYYKEI
jgi:hypothetical protein